MLGMWPRGLLEKRACGLDILRSWKPHSAMVKGIEGRVTEPGLECQLYQRPASM